MRLSRGALSALLLSLLSGLMLTARPQDPSHDPSRQSRENLQVLPQDMAPRSLDRMMKGFERDLGVRCAYCHVENRETGEIDYVSDENAKKETARIMIRMLDEINDVHLAQLGGDARYAAGVTCGSCHRGRANPQPFEHGHP